MNYLDNDEKELVYLSDIPIKRHIKLKADFNPYLPKWNLYLESRLVKSWKVIMNGRSKLLILQFRQDQRSEYSTYLKLNWYANIYHIVERYQGGGDELIHLIVLHLNYHRKLRNE